MKGLSNQNMHLETKMSVMSIVCFLVVPLGTIVFSKSDFFIKSDHFSARICSILEGCPCHQVEITPWFSTRRAFKCIPGLFTGASIFQCFLILLQSTPCPNIPKLPSTAESSKKQSFGQSVLFSFYHGQKLIKLAIFSPKNVQLY